VENHVHRPPRPSACTFTTTARPIGHSGSPPSLPTYLEL
jgi:hypothetical protein